MDPPPALPQVASLSVLAAFHGVVAVYFKDNYNLFVTNTTHTILGSTVGFLLLLKATLCYRHYSAAKQVLQPPAARPLACSARPASPPPQAPAPDLTAPSVSADNLGRDGLHTHAGGPRQLVRGRHI